LHFVQRNAEISQLNAKKITAVTWSQVSH